MQDFVLESGRVLEQAECLYKTWGTLNEQGTNVWLNHKEFMKTNAII